MAARLIGQDNGYPLPRRTVLAKRFQATIGQIDAAIDELVTRGLLRRLPSGQVHRAGPAELLISLDGLTGLSAFIDPLNHAMACTEIRVSRQRAPLNVTEALGMAPGTRVPLRRCLWTAEGTPAATLLTYAHERYAHLIGASPAAAEADQHEPCSPALTLDGLPAVARPVAAQIEIEPPARAIARRLRLASGEAAVLVTARLDTIGPAPGTPAALTVLVLRPRMFRLILDIHKPTGPALPAAGHC